MVTNGSHALNLSLRMESYFENQDGRKKIAAVTRLFVET